MKVQMEAVLGSEQTIESLVNDILEHYEPQGSMMVAEESAPYGKKE